MSTTNTTSTTLNNTLSSTVSDFFVNHVSEKLSEWLNTNKDVEVSPKELCGVFDIKYVPRSSGLPAAASAGVKMPDLPGYYSGTGASPARRGGRKKKQPVDPNGPKCEYQFTRGKRKGEACGKPVLGGDELGADRFCKACLGKKAVQSKLSSGTVGKSTVAPPHLPGGYVSIPEEDSPSNANTLSVTMYQGQENMFRDETNGFIIKQLSDGSHVAVGIDDNNNGNVRPMSQEETTLAQSIGLCVPDETPAVSISNNNNDVNVVPSVPSIPVPQGDMNIPVIPTAIPGGIPGMIPQIPN